MIEVTGVTSQADLSKLSRAIELMVKDTNRDIKQATHRAAFTFLVSGKAGTPKAKGKNRKQRGKSAVAGQLLQIPSNKRRYTKREASDKYFTIRNQGRKPFFVRIPDTMTGTKKNRAKARIQKQKVMKDWKKKPRVGAAKASWSRAFNDLGKGVGVSNVIDSRRVMGSSRAKDVGTKFAPTVNITNKLNYLLKIAPRLENKALAAAGKSLLHQVEQGIEKRNSKWR